MNTIKVENLPEDLYLKLKFSAAVNHTSLDKEVVSCLEKALMPERKINKTCSEKAKLIFDQMGLSYKAEDLKKYLEKRM